MISKATNTNLSGDVAETLKNYPGHISDKLMALRELIYEAAKDAGCLDGIDECLKWGEPSYVTKGGSTIRMGWKGTTSPEQYALYFHCQTKLIATFRELYSDKFKFEGNRAIIFKQNDNIPTAELKHCISLALTYHKRKNLPLLGA